MEIYTSTCLCMHRKFLEGYTETLGRGVTTREGMEICFSFLRFGMFAHFTMWTYHFHNYYLQAIKEEMIL